MTVVSSQILAFLDHKTREKEMAYFKGTRNMCRPFGLEV
jgi:hypothetical protein